MARERVVNPSKGNTTPTNDPWAYNRWVYGTETDPLPKRTTSVTPILPSAVPNPPQARTDTYVPLQDTPLPVIYGATRTGGLVFYDKVQASGQRVTGYAICWGEVSSISNIMIDSQTVATFAYGAVAIHLGTAGQAIDTIGSAAEPVLWTSAFPNVAYIVVRYAAPQPGVSLPNVRNLSCDVQGRKVLDPRTDPTLATYYYRDNPALILADFLANPNFGGGFPTTSMDWAGSITTAANDCDALLTDGVTKSWTMGVKLVDKKTVLDTITYLRSHAALQYVFNSGLHQIWVDKAQSPSGIVLTDSTGNDLAGQPVGSGANIVSAGPLIVHGAKQVPTRVRVNFVNAAANYKDDSLWSDDPGIVTGAVELIELTYDMGQITGDQATRIALQYRKRAAMDKSAQISTLYDGGEQVLPGVVVTITSNQLNWASQNAIVTDWAATGDPTQPWAGRVELYDNAIYNNNLQTATAYAPPAAPSPYDAVPDVASVTHTDTAPATAYWAAPTGYAFGSEYRIYRGTNPATRQLLFTIPWTALPTSSNPLVVEAAYTRTVDPVYGIQTGASWSYTVTVVSTAGIESTGTTVTGSTSSGLTGSGLSIPQTQASVVLVNGLNSNITMVALPGLAVFSGPSAPFSLGGFASGIGGVLFRVYNSTSQPMTIVNEDASSTAANRIKTMTSANVTINGPSAAWFEYNTSASRWVLVNAYDGVGPIVGVSSVDGRTGAVTLAVADVSGAAPLISPALTGTPTAPTAVGGTNTTQLATTAFVHSESPGLAPVQSVFGRIGAVAAASGDYSVAQVTGAAPLASPTFTGNVNFPGSGIWNSSGNVLIGSTIAPVGKLSVQGDSIDHAGIESRTTTGNNRRAQFGYDASGDFASFFAWDDTAGVAKNLVLQNSSGNVGIGTTGPGAKLDVKATYASDTGIGMIFRDTTGTSLNFGGDSSGNKWLQAQDDTGTPKKYLSLNPLGGNVGIGTTGPNAFRLQVAGHTGPDATFSYDLGATGTRWRALYASELRVETLVAQNTIATIGGRILVGPTCKLTADITSGATTITVDNNQMASGDCVYMESAPGGVQQIEFMAVTSAPSGTGPYSYTVTRDLDGTGANAWSAGDAVFNTGKTGSGFIDIYSVRGTKASTELGPTIVGNVRNSATFNDWSPRWAIGNLNGLYGYATNEYGSAFGVPTAAWVKIDPTNGVRIGNNSTTIFQITAAGALVFSMPASGVTGLAATATSSDFDSVTGTHKPSNNADVTLSAIQGGLSLAGGGLVLASAGASFRGGQTAYNTGTGFWLGDVSGTPKFSIGAAGGQGITWDGSTLTINGSLTLQNTIAAGSVTGLAAVATGGTLAAGNVTGLAATATSSDFASVTGATKPANNADVTLSAVNGGLSLTGGGIVLASGGACFRGGQTAYNTGTGFWLGDVSGTPKFSIGAAAGNSLTWDGSALAITGTVTASAGTIGGFTVGATELYAGTGATRVEMQVGGGFWAGATTIGAAPFAVTAAGALYATSGRIGGWTIGATTLTGGGITLDANSATIGVGTGGYNNATQKFYADGSGYFSLGTGLTWNGSALSIMGSITATFLRASASFLADYGILSGAGINVPTGYNYNVAGLPIIGDRGAAVANATNATDVITQLNTLLSRLRAHGLIAT